MFGFGFEILCLFKLCEIHTGLLSIVCISSRPWMRSGNRNTFIIFFKSYDIPNFKCLRTCVHFYSTKIEVGISENTTSLHLNIVIVRFELFLPQ